MFDRVMIRRKSTLHCDLLVTQSKYSVCDPLITVIISLVIFCLVSGASSDWSFVWSLVARWRSENATPCRAIWFPYFVCYTNCFCALIYLRPSIFMFSVRFLYICI